jgi:hypothetical protein
LVVLILLIIILILFALLPFLYVVITNILLITTCELLDVSNGRIQGSVGLFSWKDPSSGEDGECLEISAVEDRLIEDAALKCARVCSIMAIIFGGILLVFGFFKQCIIPLPCTQKLMDLSATFVQIFLGLVYVIWWTDLCDEFYCSYGNGSINLILTQLFWLAAGIFSRCMRPGRYERRDEIRDERDKKNAAKEKKKQQEMEEARAAEDAIEADAGAAKEKEKQKEMEEAPAAEDAIEVDAGE